MTIGGAIDPDETPADAAVREVWEETGLHVEPMRLVGVFGGPEFRVTYANGDAVLYTAIAFEARLLGGEARPDGHEAIALRYVSRDEAGRLPMAARTRRILAVAFERGGQPHFQRAAWTPPAPRP
jgi:8-oxo-dGTP pyrophosphatase MutT (NUDIX family)